MEGGLDRAQALHLSVFSFLQISARVNFQCKVQPREPQTAGVFVYSPVGFLKCLRAFNVLLVEHVSLP